MNFKQAVLELNASFKEELLAEYFLGSGNFTCDRAAPRLLRKPGQLI
jgi:hypothetical protein